MCDALLLNTQHFRPDVQPNITCSWHTFIHLGGSFSIWDKVNHAMGDQVVAGDTYEEEEEESFFQDVDMLQSYGIVS